MKSILEISCIAVLLSSSVSFAEGNKVGNGGDGVFCKGSEENGQLLDFYEKDLKFSITEKDPYVIAKDKFTELKKVAPKLGEQYLKRLSSIREELDFKEHVELTDIKDSNHLFKPADPNCKVLQMVIRRKTTLPIEKRFVVRKDLWNQLPPVQQAGLISHEIIYEHLMKLGATNSEKARALNRYIFSEKLETTSFWKFITELEVSIYP